MYSRLRGTAKPVGMLLVQYSLVYIHFCGHRDLSWIESMVWLRIVCPKCACSVSEWDWKSVFCLRHFLKMTILSYRIGYLSMFCWSALPATTARSLSLQRLSMRSSGTFSFTLPRHHAIHNYVQTFNYLTASWYTCLHHVKNTPQHHCNISCNNCRCLPPSFARQARLYYASKEKIKK